MRFGTALVTDVELKTLDDYEDISAGSLANDSENLVIPHDSVTSLKMQADPSEHRRRDFFVYWVMKRQKEIFQVYNFEMKYQKDQKTELTLRFYAVPLGVYFKPRRQTQTRETILRDYAFEILETYRTILLGRIISSSILSNLMTT